MAECEALVRRMDLEARSVSDPSAKAPMLSKLRDYKSELARLKRHAREATIGHIRVSNPLPNFDRKNLKWLGIRYHPLRGPLRL